MFGSSNTIRRLAGLVGIAGAFAVLVPVAQAGSGFNGSPDAIDRAVAAEQAKKVAAIDARERSMLTRPVLESVGTPPDAFERALITHADGVTSRTIPMLDAGLLPTRTVESRFNWSDFGIGAGAGIGFILIVVGLGAGVLVVRHSHGRVTNL